MFNETWLPNSFGINPVDSLLASFACCCCCFLHSANSLTRFSLASHKQQCRKCWSDCQTLVMRHNHPGVSCLSVDIKTFSGWNSGCDCFLFSLFRLFFFFSRKNPVSFWESPLTTTSCPTETNLTTFSPDLLKNMWFTCWKWWRGACAEVLSSRWAGSLAALVQADNFRLRLSCDQSAKSPALAW